MELKVFKDTLAAAGGCYDAKAELPVETEILIPDYQPAVFKIVKCRIVPVILQNAVADGRWTAQGYLRCTGKSGRLIFDNLRFLSDSGARIEIRIPLVPGYNDDEATLRGIGGLLSEVRTTKVRLLPYHSYARSKYAALGLDDTLPCADSPDKSALEAAAALLREYKLNVII